MIDSPTRWKANGLPRKGWRCFDVTDTETIENECDWCGTEIRYLHHLYHDEQYIEAVAGCVCTEHLTNDYVNPKKREKELKCKKRQYKKFYDSFKQSKKGNLYNNSLSEIVIIMIKNDKYQLKIGDIYGKKIYNVVDDAVKAAFSYLIK